MNWTCWSLLLGGIKSCLQEVACKRCILRWCQKELNVLEERIESGREFQIPFAYIAVSCLDN